MRPVFHALVLASVLFGASFGCGRLGYGGDDSGTGPTDSSADTNGRDTAFADTGTDSSDAASDTGPPVDSAADTGGSSDAGIDPALIVWLPLDGDPALGTEDVLGVLGGARCDPGRCPVSAPGVVGQGYAFDGIDDYIRFDSNPMLDFGGREQAFSVAVWYRTRRRTPTSVQQVVFAQATGGGSVGFQLSFEDLMSGGTYDLVWKVCETNCSIGPFAVVEDGVEADVWRLAVGVWTGTESVLYIDAVEVARSTTNGINYDGLPFMLGADFEGVGAIEDSFDGIIDDLRIYERVLTDSDQSRLLAARGGS